MRGVIKAHPTTKGDILQLPLSDGPICQISVQRERVYALSESGSLQVCYKRSDSFLLKSGQSVTKGKQNTDDDGLEDEYNTYVMGIPPSPGLVGNAKQDELFSDEEAGGRLGDEDGQGMGHQKSK
jgi:hypothetical protein